MKKVKLFLTALVIAATTFVASAQNQVSGVVTDRNGEPVAGASVVVDGTTIGVITGSNGAYTISAKPGQTLSFLFYGMKPLKQEVTGATMNVVMEDDLMLLDEAVVTAMGITRSEKSIGYAATTVKNEEIAGQRATNVTNTLAGKVAGLQINSTSTDPGAATSVVIRGYSSIAGSNQPLYVVDGIPMTGITSIAPDNIEAMTVLKGAAATALYGSRAANGVIIVTTKQGKRNADRNFSIEYNGGVQARQLANLPIFQNDFGQGWNGTQTWIENGSWGPRLDGSYQVYGPVWNGKQRYGKFEALPTNIQDFFEIGWSQNHSVALSGISDDQKMTYYLSYANSSDDGIMPYNKDKYTRNTITMSSSYAPVSWLKVSSTINFALSKTDAVLMDQGAFAIDGLLEFPRNISLVDLKDTSNPFNTPEAYLTPYGITNPYWAIENNYNHTDQKSLFGKVQADVMPFDFLTLTYRYGFNYGDFDYKNGVPQISLTDALIYDDKGYAPSSMNQDGSVAAQYYRNYEFNHDFMATYNDDFIDGDLTVTAILGTNINERASTYMNGVATGLAFYSGFWDLSNGADWTDLAEAQTKRRLVGVFGDVTLGYKDTFFLDLTARNDWSSTLPMGKNSFFYPGVTASFIFTNLMPKNDILSFGKIRASYGKTGNDAGVYRTNPAYVQAAYRGYYGSGIASFPMNGVNAFARSARNNSSSLRPEMTTEFEVGTNLQFFEGRIGIDAAYYNKLTSDQIFNVTVDPGTGYTSAVTNFGVVRNRGVELLFDFVPVQTRDFRWDLSVNWAKNWSKVVSLPENFGGRVAINGFSAGNDAVYMYAEEGQPIGTFWTYQSRYYDDPDSEYDGWIIVDEEGQPKQTKSVQPTGKDMNFKWTGGLTTQFAYKSLALSATLDVRYGGYMFSRTRNIMQFTGNGIITTYNDRRPFIIPNSICEYVDDDGNVLGYDENVVPLYLSNSSYQTYFNDHGYGMSGEAYLMDRSYAKLRNITLTWNLPKKWIGPFSNIGLSAFVNNAFTWTARDNYYVDPEATTEGTDLVGTFGEMYNNPSCRIYGFNVNLKF